MKIALLTLRVDNNYGGNLQRFALCHFLQIMGHDVTFLYFRSEWNNDGWFKRIIKMIPYLIKTIYSKSKCNILYWKYEDPEWEKNRENTIPFFYKYVKHSPLIWSMQTLTDYIKNENFDAYIVGSDQVWRKRFTERWGLERFYLDFAPSDKKKVFYAASFGIPQSEYSSEDIDILTPLYKKFYAVSVREESALRIIDGYGWTTPHAVLTLDPTLLLGVDVYKSIVDKSDTIPSKGDMFCYILDSSEEIMYLVNSIARDRNLTPFYATLSGKYSMSIEQWLRSFLDSKFVVTDSYHGLVFSVIFNKPFYLLYNSFRGNARFESLLHLLNINEDRIDWGEINKRISIMQMKSKDFIEDALK